MDWKARITSDPAVCHGKACIAGTRVLVSVILDNLAEGESPATVARAYQVSEADVNAALHYAAELAKDRVVSLGVA
jgi:uncharacterized protein (DUF433 family)